MAHARAESDVSESFSNWDAHWDDVGTDTSAPPRSGRWSSSSPPLAADTFELTSDGRIWSGESHSNPQARAAYAEGDSIDWLHETAVDRARRRALRARPGWRRTLLPGLDASKMWIVLALTGVGIGVIGAWLDVLVKWLGDLREGRCSYGLFYNQVTCCTGLDPGEVCYEWQSWSQYFNVHSTLGESLLQAFVYIALAVAFAGAASVLVRAYAPYAFHTGIPEVIAILGGYVLDSFLSPWTLLIKAVGVALAVASGLSLGKEGPLVHIACCMAYLLCGMFPEIKRNEGRKRKLLAAAAAAGVSVAFGSPIGGVLFGLEELDTFAAETETMWRAFVTSALAAVALQYADPFGTARLVLFQVGGAVDDAWRAFEVVPWVILAVIGGLLGSLLIKLNTEMAVYRRNSQLYEWPVLEVVGGAAITAALSYLVVFMRVPASELVANLFQECDISSKGDYHGLCNPTALWRNVFLLLLTAGFKVALTAWTFGMMIPAGVFLPSIAIGACVGRAVGLLTQGLHRAHPNLWVFSACPPDPTIPCISPGFYAVVGAAAMLGGVTRMTLSLVVIMFELTGALSHVLPIMLAVVVSKWVADAFGGTAGVYAQWIALRRYPWLSHAEYRDQGQNAASIMRPVNDLVVLRDGMHTLRELDEITRRHAYRRFPVVRGQNELLGCVMQRKLQAAIDALLSADAASSSHQCFFTPESVRAQGTQAVDLSSVLDMNAVTLKRQVPLELVVTTFQKMNVQQVFFTEAGILQGMATKSDVVRLLSSQIPFAGALQKHPGETDFSS